MIPFIETSLGEIENYFSFPRKPRPDDERELEMYFNPEAIRAYSKSKAQRRRQIERVLEALEILDYLGVSLEGKRILDVGCGPGFSMEPLESLGEVLGIDVLDEMVKAAREQGHKCQKGDITKSSFPGFDVIFSFSALQWIPEEKIPLASRNLADSLKTPGIAVLHFYPKSKEYLSRWVRELSRYFRVRIFVTRPRTRKAGLFLVCEKKG